MSQMKTKNVAQVECLEMIETIRNLILEENMRLN
jgi:hypothetical protein